MKISVIIPAYNAQKTLRETLASVYASEFKDYEVMVIDDLSNDQTVEIAKEFNCRIRKSEGYRNRALARNTGIKESRGEILVFIDSDIVIKPDSLGLIWNNFQDNPEISGLTGMLSKYTPDGNFLTQYKNLYLHYIFKNMPKEIEFLYGGICALRREAIYKHNLFFDKEIARANDTELGARITQKGLKIFLIQDLIVTHLKVYHPISFLKNEFFIPFDFTISMFKNRTIFHSLKKTRFAHTSIKQAISVGLTLIMAGLIPFIFINLKVLSLILSLFVLFLALNLNFLIFLKKEKGGAFFLKSLFLLYFDFFIMGMGMISAGAHYFIKRIFGLCKR